MTGRRPGSSYRVSTRNVVCREQLALTGRMPMDEQAAGAVALALVVLIMAAFLAASLVSRTWPGPLWIGLGVGLVATVAVAALSEVRGR